MTIVDWQGNVCEYGDLSCRASNILHNLDVYNKEQALKAYKEGKLVPSKRPRNYGPKTDKELRKWLGLPEVIKRDRSKCPNCGCQL